MYITIRYRNVYYFIKCTKRYIAFCFHIYFYKKDSKNDLKKKEEGKCSSKIEIFFSATVIFGV